jgi:hypothetical protein
LTAPDYFLWGTSAHRLQTIDELKTAISREVHAIPQDMLRRVMEAFPHCLEQCVQAEGGHLEDVIFKVH